MKPTIKTAIIAALCSVPAPALAGGPSGGPFEITWYSIDAGGGESAGGAFTLAGTIGQPEAGPELSGGPFTLRGGFWAGVNSDLPCPADLTGDGVLNFFDVSAFLTAFNNHAPLADFTGDGNYNFFDVSLFLQSFVAGCP